MERMDDDRLRALVEPLKSQKYPLSINEETAAALAEAVRRIKEQVPIGDRTFIREDYDLVVTALMHASTTSV